MACCTSDGFEDGLALLDFCSDRPSWRNLCRPHESGQFPKIVIDVIGMRHIFRLANSRYFVRKKLIRDAHLVEIRVSRKAEKTGMLIFPPKFPHFCRIGN